MRDHELLRYVDAETRRLGLEQAIGKDALEATLHSPITIEHAAASWAARNALHDTATGRPFNANTAPCIGHALNTPGFLEHWADLRVRFSQALRQSAMALTMERIASEQGKPMSDPWHKA